MANALNPAEIEQVLKTHPAWTLQRGKLVREWTFKDFLEAMQFVNRIAGIAEAADHHPDIDIRYNRVLLGLVTHDASGITGRDAAMLNQIEKELSLK